MSTFNLTQIRKFALIAAVAAFAAQAEAAGTSALVDTQTKVGASVSGARTELNAVDVRGADVSSRATDGQVSTQQILLGINSSTTDSNRGTDTAASSTRSSIGSNGQSNGESQKLTQALVLGRAAS